MRRSLRSVEVAAWCLGTFCASTLMYDRVEAVHVLREADRIVSSAAAPSPSVQWKRSAWSPAPVSKTRPADKADDILGRLEIPALHLSTPIIEDSNDSSLMVGAGHVRGTAMPGGLGNFVIAAHRDTYFRPLAGIRPGMHMQVVTDSGSFTYVVDAMQIVMPDDVDVLDMGDVPQMTLITCYPFHYVGSAPKRFVVKAHLLDY